VQINFGVVLNESMGEEVKITVIATGFERENLPAIERRKTAAEASSVPAPEEPALQMELPEPEPVAVEAAAEPEAVYVEPEETPITVAAVANGTATPPAAQLFDDLDVPAILRRDRRFVQ
jgi:cell division protein FtsZ